MAIPYNATSPQPGDLLSTSQNDLLTNFSSINLLVNQDHVPFTGTNPGQHNQVSLASQGTFGVQPIPVFNPLTQIGLFSQVSPVGLGAQNELYINKVNQATTVQVPATASILSSNSNPGFITPGWTYLPSGLIIKWNQNVSFSAATKVVLVNAFGPVLTSIAQVLITPVNNGTNSFDHIMSVTAVAATQFTVKTENGGTPGAGIQFNWVVIGY